MNYDLSNLADSKRSAAKSLYTAFEILNENGGELPRKQIIEEMSKRIDFEPWETERYESNGQLKWLTIFLFYTVNCIKAGWLVKNKGIWFLTEEGKELIKLGPIVLVEESSKAYKQWKITEGQNSNGKTEPEIKDIDISDEQVQQATLDELEAQANEGIGKYLESISPYKFQELCSTLLQAMGYYIDFEAPPGKDGGVDIIAFKDSLGFEKPRIKVQVKNYNEKNKIDVKAVRELRGILNPTEHVGIFITSGYFTKDAADFARHSDIHIKLIDRTSFISLWIENYSKISDENKKLMPIHPIYFLGSTD